jgi:TolB-like protein/protein involved in temperature-dependent protein secretion
MGLSLKMLGGFELRDGSGGELSLPTRKVRALLSYLAVNADKPQPRERLMALLWSDRGERQARQSLNQALMAIRRLGEHGGVKLLESDGDRVMLPCDALECDVEHFQALAADDPVQATKCYTGPFLDNVSIAEPSFEQWQHVTRAQLHDLACGALGGAAEKATISGEFKPLIEFAKRLLSQDPLHEDSHRLLMQLLYENGDRAAALRQYRVCAEILEKELQVEPDSKTKALMERIRLSTGDEKENRITPTEPRPRPPEKPSIAVLPFENLSKTPTVELLTDGLSEDLITSLVKTQELLVIPRHSTAIYKGQTVNLQQVAEALGVQYVLGGSIQTSDDKMRCSVQLIDCAHGRHLWADRYSRRIDDIFSVQDEIVWNVLIELQIRLTEGDIAVVASRGTRSIDAWLLRVQAAAELKKYTREGTIRARKLLEAAHGADPDWARPLSGLAFCDYLDVKFGWSMSQEESIKRGIEFAKRAIAIDPEDSLPYQALRNFNMVLGDLEKALSFAEKAAALAPNDGQAVGIFAATLLYMDETAQAVAAFERAARLMPNMFRDLQRLHGLALHLVGNVDHAVAVLETLAHQNPDWSEGLAQLAVAYQSAGRVDKAQAIVEQILKLDQGYSASRHLAPLRFRNPDRINWLREQLVEAGLPK